MKKLIVAAHVADADLREIAEPAALAVEGNLGIEAANGRGQQIRTQPTVPDPPPFADVDPDIGGRRLGSADEPI